MKKLLLTILFGVLATPSKAAIVSLGASGLADGQVTTAKIVAGAVTTSKLAQDAVTATAILTGSVTTAKIAAGAVTTSKIAVEALTPLKLDAANGRASINLTTPLSALAVNGASASGPTATDKGIFQFQSSADAIGMSAGAYSASPYGLYFQGHDPRSGQNSTYPLLLNPIGGNVGIGTTNPLRPLQVGGAATIVGVFDVVNASITLAGPNGRSGGTCSGETLCVSNAGNASMSIVAGAGNAGALYFEDDTYLAGSVTYNHTANSMQLSTNQTEALRINSSQNVGIGTTNPTSKFQVDAGTFSVYSTGIVSMPSQPAVKVRSNQARPVPFNTFVQVFFDTAEINHNGMWVVTSSGIITVPVGGGGGYIVTCNLKMDTADVTFGDITLTSISKNGAGNRNIESIMPISASETSNIATGILDLAAGDTLRCEAYQNADAAGSTLVDTNAGYSFSAVKVW